jgi:hypothetical protein
MRNLNINTAITDIVHKMSVGADCPKDTLLDVKVALCKWLDHHCNQDTQQRHVKGELVDVCCNTKHT